MTAALQCRFLHLTCGGIEAGISGFCEQPGSVFSLRGCCRQAGRGKKCACKITCWFFFKFSTWGSVCRSGSIAGWGLLLYDFVGTSSSHGNSGNDSGSGLLPGSSSYKVHTDRQKSSTNMSKSSLILSLVYVWTQKKNTIIGRCYTISW